MSLKARITLTEIAAETGLSRMAVSLALRGYEVHHQVGCSGYRIDLAVVDPDDPGRYLLGVECDGATYPRAATARDRNKLRQAILEDLGWKLHRIWSTDWWHDPGAQALKLLAAVDAQKAGKDHSKEQNELLEPNDGGQTIGQTSL